jgi:4a-hydroxytetrahydrobiopterin dehydratase
MRILDGAGSGPGAGGPETAGGETAGGETAGGETAGDGAAGDGALSRTAVSTAIGDLGWRYVLGVGWAAVRVGSLAAAAEVAVHAAAAAGPDADRHLRVDVRPDRALLAVATFARDLVSPVDLAVIARVTAAVRGMGLTTEPVLPGARSVQMIEIAIDALDIPAVLPFWRAALGYVDAPGSSIAIVDPLGQGAAVWFQQMGRPRPQRNRIHLDISVPHDEAAGRLSAALAAGGTLLSDEAPAFWVLADPEGNEACITTWQGRD